MPVGRGGQHLHVRDVPGETNVPVLSGRRPSGRVVLTVCWARGRTETEFGDSSGPVSDLIGGKGLLCCSHGDLKTQVNANIVTKLGGSQMDLRDQVESVGG